MNLYCGFSVGPIVDFGVSLTSMHKGLLAADTPGHRDKVLFFVCCIVTHYIIVPFPSSLPLCRSNLVWSWGESDQTANFFWGPGMGANSAPSCDKCHTYPPLDVLNCAVPACLTSWAAQPAISPALNLPFSVPWSPPSSPSPPPYPLSLLPSVPLPSPLSSPPSTPSPPPYPPIPSHLSASPPSIPPPTIVQFLACLLFTLPVVGLCEHILQAEAWCQLARCLVHCLCTEEAARPTCYLFQPWHQ